MICDNLYDTVLINPAQRANNLFIVSGYASPEFVVQHINKLPSNVTINLIIGMAVRDGISKHSHEAFKNLVREFPNRFNCFYLTTTPCHSKAYAWFNNTSPVCGYTGSANYSLQAFHGFQNEILEKSNPQEILNYFNQLLECSIQCTDEDVYKYIPITTQRNHTAYDIACSPKFSNTLNKSANTLNEHTITSNESITLTLLEQRAYRVPKSSGINWGQREGRNPDQAYITIPSSIYNGTFFPEPRIPFTIITDDGSELKCVRAQDNGKAIETCDDNSLLGRYLRYRISVPYGQAVVISDFEKYGRNNVTITKISDFTYFLDFSV